MRILFAGLLLQLAFSTAGFAQSAPTVGLTAGLEATVTAVGRSKDLRGISVTMQIENKGKFPIQIALVGPAPNAADNAGVTFAFSTFSGAAQCRELGPTYTRACILADGGVSNSEYYLIPLQQFTQIDPGSTTSLTFGLRGGESNGTQLGFASVFAFRVVADPLKDETQADAERRKQIRTMSISFPSFPITQQK